MARDEGPGFWELAKRALGGGENPLAWALHVYTWRGVRVRLQLFSLIFVLAIGLQTLAPGSLGFAYVGPVLVAVFGIVLLHEYGHVFACLRLGGEADEILLTPIGGLAFCRPPHDWRSHMVTTVAGPAVNAVLLPVLSGLVWAATGSLGAAFFNPFDPSSAVGHLAAGPGEPAWVFWGRVVLWSVHYANLIMLGFNVLLPMYPLDGGRMLHALLWRRTGHARATLIAATVGLAVAIGLGVFAAVFTNGLLLAIALFAGFTCWQERRRVQLGEAEDEAYDVGFGPGGAEAWKRGGEERASAEERRRAAEAARVKEREAEEQEELDRLLAKIAEHGMASLTRKEQRALERATARRRGEEAGTG